MDWIWGERDPNKVRKKVPHTETSRDLEVMSNTVNIHMELVIKSPIEKDVVETIKQMMIDFSLPNNTTVVSTHLTHVELLSRGGIE